MSHTELEQQLFERLKNVALVKPDKTEDEPLVLRSSQGTEQNWLFDLRALITQSDDLDLITEVFWEKMADVRQTVTQPAMFVAGEKDGVIAMSGDALEKMPERVTDLRICELLPGIGHWTQQEAPEDVNRLLLEFLNAL